MRRPKYTILGSDGDEYGPFPAEKILQWIAESRVEKSTPVIRNDGGDWVFLETLPEFSAAFESPSALKPVPAGTTASPAGLDEAAPQKNSRALASCYLGVLSIIPPFGALLGIPALILGISGLHFRRRNPAAGGRGHAWAGIFLGALFGFGYLALVALAIIGGIVRGHRMS